MKPKRLLGAICAALLMLAPARAAEQSSYVMPVTGPMSMAVFAGTHLNPALRALASCHNGSSAPANGTSGAPLAYQCWVDTTANPSLYKIYDGTSWVTLGSLNTSTHAWIPYLTGGTSGGVPYFSSSGVMASSAALAQNGVVIGGGAGAAPASVTAGTDDQVLFGRTGNSPLFRSVTGDVTFATGVSAIGANKVTNGQLRQSGALSLIGRTANSTGDVADISASAGSSCAFRESSNTIGCGTLATAAYANNSVTDAKLRQSAALSLIGRSANSTGDVADISASAGSSCAFRESSNTIACGTLATAAYAGNSVTNAKLAQMANNTVKCRVTAGTGDPEDCTATQGRSVLGLGTAAQQNTGTSGANVPLLNANNTHSGTNTFTGTADFQVPAKLSSFVTSTQITSNQNNYTATDGSNTCSTKQSLRISSDASRNVTGLSCGQAEGDIRIIHNVGAQNIVLTNQDTNSTAANRFLFGGDVTLLADYSITVKYDATTSRWRAITTASAGGGGGTVTSAAIAAGTGISTSGTCTITTSGTCTVATSLSNLSNSIGVDVNMNNTANYFDGPSVAQGTSGTWFASGAVSVVDTAGIAAVFCKLWDGTTVIASARVTTGAASQYASVALSGVLASPAGNIKISCRDSTSTSGIITANGSGNSKDGTVTAIRIQ